MSDQYTPQPPEQPQQPQQSQPPQEPQEDKAMPSVGTQIKVVVIVIVGITVVLGGGFLLSQWLG